MKEKKVKLKSGKNERKKYVLKERGVKLSNKRKSEIKTSQKATKQERKKGV